MLTFPIYHLPLPFQFPFLPFRCHPNPDSLPFSGGLVSTVATWAKLCTTSFLGNSGLVKLGKHKKGKIIRFNRGNQDPKPNGHKTCKKNKKKSGGCGKKARTDILGSLISSWIWVKIVLSDTYTRNEQEISKCLILLIFNVNEKSNLFWLIIKSALNSRLKKTAAVKVIIK